MQIEFYNLVLKSFKLWNIKSIISLKTDCNSFKKIELFFKGSEAAFE